MDFVNSTVYVFSRILYSHYFCLFKFTCSAQYCTPVVKYSLPVSLFFPYHNREVAHSHKTAVTLVYCRVFGYSVEVRASDVIM